MGWGWCSKDFLMRLWVVRITWCFCAGDREVLILLSCSMAYEKGREEVADEGQSWGWEEICKY